MTIQQATVLIRNSENVTDSDAILARGADAFEQANSGERPATVDLISTEECGEYKAYTFEIGA